MSLFNRSVASCEVSPPGSTRTCTTFSAPPPMSTPVSFLILSRTTSVPSAMVLASSLSATHLAPSSASCLTFSGAYFSTASAIAGPTCCSAAKSRCMSLPGSTRIGPKRPFA